MGHLIPVDLSTLVHASNKFAEIQSAAEAFTGPQSNVQNGVVNNDQVGGKGAFNLNYSPITQDADNTAYTYADSYPSIFPGISLTTPSPTSGGPWASAFSCALGF